MPSGDRPVLLPKRTLESRRPSAHEALYTAVSIL
jgi:hypothetical protein